MIDSFKNRSLKTDFFELKIQHQQNGNDPHAGCAHSSGLSYSEILSDFFNEELTRYSSRDPDLNVMLLPLFVRKYYISEYFKIYRKTKKPGQQRPYGIIPSVPMNILIVDAMQNRHQWPCILKKRYFKSKGLHEIKLYYRNL